MRRWAQIVLCALLAAPVALADVIVLKTGRRITATNVVEEGDRVFYETSAGRLSLRREQVERIERTGGSSQDSGAASSSAADAQVGPPKFDQSDQDVYKQVIRDGSIDRDYLARLENDPQSSSATMANRIAIAHHAAAQFELEKGNTDAAVGHYRRALNYAPEHVSVLLTIGYLHLRRSEYTQAVEYLERAKRVAPEAFEVAKLLGWSYYRTNKFDAAVRELKRAQGLRADAEVAGMLEKVQRDQQGESEYREGETRHFSLRYHGSAAPQLAREILRTLEAQFQTIESELNFAPPESIGVVLYTDQDFMDITQAPSWAGALNDGRIRVPVQGLASVTPELSSTLKHELTHSFIFQKTLNRAPMWLHEGVAQWMEGKRSGENASVLVEVAGSPQEVSIAVRVMKLRSFGGLPPAVAGYAYAWSLAVVEYMVQTNGLGDIVRILDRINTEPTPEEGIRSVVRMNYADLETETIQYIKRTYPR